MLSKETKEMNKQTNKLPQERPSLPLLRMKSSQLMIFPDPQGLSLCCRIQLPARKERSRSILIYLIIALTVIRSIVIIILRLFAADRKSFTTKAQIKFKPIRDIRIKVFSAYMYCMREFKHSHRLIQVMCLSCSTN